MKIIPNKMAGVSCNPENGRDNSQNYSNIDVVVIILKTPLSISF